MLKHYITQALRSFWRFRVTAGVNLLGLVLAVVCFVASYLYIDSLVRSDMHFPKASRRKPRSLLRALQRDHLFNSAMVHPGQELD